MDDESRRALRNLARRAEWRGRPGAAGATTDARTLQELGREIQALLASEQDRSTWGHSASEALAAHCLRARPDWSADQTAELTRLRGEALTALAPGPGETDPDADSDRAPGAADRRDRRVGINSLSTLTNRAPRRLATIALAVVGCLVLIALVLAAPHFLSHDSNEATSSTTTTTVPAAPTDTDTVPTSTSASTPTSPSSSAEPSSTNATTPSVPGSPSAVSTSRVTKIQMTTSPAQDYPEVLIYGTITTSGTGDVTVNITVSGSSGQPQVTPLDESGQTSYALSQTLYLKPWCGQNSVQVTVSSGNVSKSATVPLSGC